MQDKPSDYRPLEEPGFDFTISCKIDDAVKYLLGWLRGPLRYHDDPDDDDEFDLSVDTLLRNNRELAEAAWSNAKLEKRDDEIIKAKLAALRKCDLEIERAHYYFCRIDDELAKGNESELRIDPVATTNPQAPFITLASLDRWAQDQLSINIFRSSPGSEDHEQSHPENEAPSKGGLSKTKATNLQITFALLVEKFASTASKYQNNGKPNVSAIAGEIAQLAVSEKLPGQSKEAIKSCIENAMKIKDDPPM